MSNPAAAPDPDDEVLARIMLDLERSGGPGANLEAYLAGHPHLADQIRELFQMRRALDRSRPDADEPQPRQLGEFRIVRRIARGGMGEIYEAEQERLNRSVAIKVIRRGRISPEARDRFLREQAVLARLHQTHIVPIHTAGEEGPLQYFAMPYIEGAALHHVVRTALQLETSQPGSKTPSVARLAGMVAADSRRESQASSAGAAPVEETVTSTQAQGSGAPAAARVPGLRLSLEYFRSVAQVMADAAEALHHAHEVRIIHRDVKPSNLMVDTAGQCWVIDFGLAGYLDGHGGAGLPEKPDLGPEPAPASGIMGTPQYMAPEQFDSRADARTDVWGLGVTLYELLTLRRAFDAPTAAGVRDHILSGVPLPPRELVGNVPPDLAAICLKALRKEPAQRYPTAMELADDLRRWLRWEPTVARPARTPRRMALWARRNKSGAAAMTIGAIALFTLIAGGWLLAEGRAETANARAATANAEADAANERARKVEVEAQLAREQGALELQELQRLRLSIHENDWSRKAWEQVHRLAERYGRDANLRDQAAATLVGLDVKRIKTIDRPATALAFDSTGKRLLMGGYGNQGARLWDEKDEIITSRYGGQGPVAFRDSETPLQVAFQRTKDGLALLLWNVAKQQEVRTFKVPAKADWRFLSAALNTDASFLAIAAGPPTEAGKKPEGQVVVWNARSGEELQKFDRRPTALALSPDGKLLAAGDEEGEISVWSLPGGELLATLVSDRNRIQSLAFGRNFRRSEPGKRKPTVSHDWLLAAGDTGGTVAIWDLERKVPRTYCRGSSYDVYALAFSGDGAALASAGRGRTKVWDVATGRLLLNVSSGNITPGVVFSRDGQKLAYSVAPAFGHTGQVDVWELEHGRGIQTLRGLAGQVAQVVFSADRRLLAAIAHDWQVGIWEAASGQLLHVLDVPRGLLADNAALAFSADGKQFAFATGQQAKLWEVATGKELKSWELPPGLVDRLAFHPSGKLLLFRVETEDMSRFPLANAPFTKFPRVCRIRDLHQQDYRNPLWTITDFNKHVFQAEITPDGSHALVAGLHDGPDGAWPKIQVRDSLSGAIRSSQELSKTNPDGTMSIDPPGKILAFQPNNQIAHTRFADIASGKLLDSVDLGVHVLGPGARYYGWQDPKPPYGLCLYRAGLNTPLVRLNLDGQTTTVRPQFDSNGSHLAWGNADGTVTVCDINEVQRRLAAVGMGW